MSNTGSYQGAVGGGESPVSSTSSHVGDEARFQPPFPQPAVSPTSTHTPLSPRQPPPHHPHIEDAINATAAHVAPEHPAPRREPGEGQDVSHEGIGRDNEVHSRTPQPGEGKRREERDPSQMPIIKGTPLDEMRTPMFERSSAFPQMDAPSTRQQGAIGSLPERRSQEVEDPFEQSPPSSPSTPQPRDGRAGEEDIIAQQMGKAAPRPGFGASHEMGSVSRFTAKSTSSST